MNNVRKFPEKLVNKAIHRSVGDFEGIDYPEEQERIQRDAYERVNALLKKLGISA
jgi:hypothetical protein